MKSLSQLVNQELKSNKLFFETVISREERHYCAFLFSWFIIDKKTNLKSFFKHHSKNSIFEKLTDKDFEETKIYFEYTGIRELIHFLTKQCDNKDLASIIKSKSEEIIFEHEKSGDIQKKKADLVFYFPESKILVMNEAKFEESFKINQIETTQKYGEFLQDIFPNEIKKVITTALGLNHHIDVLSKKLKKEKLNFDINLISWEKLTTIIENKTIKTEIIKGLNYQKQFHKRAMENW